MTHARRAFLWSLILPLIALIGSIVHAVGVGSRVRATDIPRLVVLDVGQGDAILLDAPGDAEVLIDGGPDDGILERLEEHLGRDRTINLMVLTHPHADHVVGLLEVLREYTVDRALITGVVHTTAVYQELLSALRDRHVPTSIAVVGQAYPVGPFSIDVLHPLQDLSGVSMENVNLSSIVLRVAAHGSSTLLTGDAETEVERALLEAGADLDVDVLKVPHQGSQDSSSSAFLNAVTPEHAIISVGTRNQFGHPHRRALKRLERTGAQMWRTDRQGDITVTFGQSGLAVSSER